MGSNIPSAASSCGPAYPLILWERPRSTSNKFLVAKDDWVQGFALSPGTFVRHKDLPRVFHWVDVRGSEQYRTLMARH